MQTEKHRQTVLLIAAALTVSAAVFFCLAFSPAQSKEVTTQSRQVLGEECAPASKSKTDEPVNINTASAEELTALYGVGTVKAEEIIAYRNENGGFCCLEELMQVKGINRKIYKKNVDSITIE